MTIPTELIGSIPRPAALIEGMKASQSGRKTQKELNALFDSALRDTTKQFEDSGSPVITDGEQTKPSFATYPAGGLKTLAPNGVTIPFADGHTRQLPTLTAGPFRYAAHAADYLVAAQRIAHRPIKQAVISASVLSLLYPSTGIAGYSQDAFTNDLIRENEADIQQCLQKGAYKVQIDFTEARLSLKLDPSGNLLKSFVGLNNRVLDRFSPEERQKIGVHTCPGGDRDSTHSADIDHAALIPSLFDLQVGSFYFQMASERDRPRVLKIIKQYAKPEHQIFIGVTDPINPKVETAEEVRDRVMEAAKYIPLNRLGTTDDCGFSPFGDDTSTSRETAFAKIRSRVEGTALAAKALQA